MSGLLIDTASVAGTSLASPSLTQLSLITALPSGVGPDYSTLSASLTDANDNDSGILIQSVGASTQTGSFTEASDLHTLTLRTSTSAGKNHAEKTSVASASSSSPANRLQAGGNSGLSKLAMLTGSIFVCSFLAAL